MVAFRAGDHRRYCYRLFLSVAGEYDARKGDSAQELMEREPIGEPAKPSEEDFAKVRKTLSEDPMYVMSSEAYYKGYHDAVRECAAIIWAGVFVLAFILVVKGVKNGRSD